MGGSVRVDSWTWSVRLFKTRSAAASACRGGHVRVDGVTAKPSTPVTIGTEVRVRVHGMEKVVEVAQLVNKRVGAPIAATTYIDHSPPPPPKEVLASIPRRDRGAGRPTKKERREMDRLRGFNED
ncbi:RNA-binding S4 domain-containing protein [Rhodococcus sp. HNM0563]|uniref:RNA-binding S4 domain-containing protein n=1 Tax=unclassified Rhodococcus (in: high G+C Gram-positive bacteria) TaxID=192944 RepID=UPI00146E1C2C|nr:MULTISPECIES: RNA-binding S4 domain-containing protein [unclassified Rhodococcus (in: high G+C Gram-positive bacteria)]MCK0089499.1 RNA-binding S4 domain-containing protein [Rhodococcus sp. F64268]NLU63026.1 RNA-binding S4 domain-containing protein [Rhodococcus sp. HNM0563]